MIDSGPALSAPTVFNWDRGYRLALEALAERPPLSQMVSPVRLAKEQFQVALLSKAAADAGVLRYVSFLAVRDWIGAGPRDESSMWRWRS